MGDGLRMRRGLSTGLAGQAGQASGRRHRRRRQRPVAEGQEPRRVGRADPGPHRDRRQADGRARRQAPRGDAHARDDLGPVVASSMRTIKGKKYGVVRLDQFSSGAHAEVNAALRKRLKDRASRASSLTCAATRAAWSPRRSWSPARSWRTARSSRPRGARCRPRRSAPSATRSRPRPRSSSWSTATAPRPRRSSRRAAGPQAGEARRHAHVRQGRLPGGHELSNGGALDITAGQYFTPKGRNLGGGGRQAGRGIEARREGAGRPKTPRRRGAGQRAARARGRS